MKKVRDFWAADCNERTFSSLEECKAFISASEDVEDYNDSNISHWVETEEEGQQVVSYCSVSVKNGKAAFGRLYKV